MKRLKKLITGILATALLSLTFASANIIERDDSWSNTWIPSASADEDEEEGEENQGEEEEIKEQSLDEILGEIDPVEAPNNTKTTQELIQEVSKTATKAHGVFAPLINFFSFQIGNFLGNDYIYQGAMGDMLQKIWVMARNLVNIFFVFYLLFMAIRTIFWPESSLDDLKKGMIKFVLLLVAVNFSWLGAKVVLDAASVTTHAIFAIPSGIGDPPDYQECQVNTNGETPIKGLCYPTKIIAPAESSTQPILYFQDKEGDDDNCSEIEEAYKEVYDEDTGELKNNIDPKHQKLIGRTSMCMESLNLFKYDQNTATIYLTYGMARIQNLANATSSGGSGSQLAVGVLMSIILQVVYAIALLALFITLIVRMMMLWFLVAFSPFLVALVLFEGKNPAEEYFSFPQFINWAFAPAKVGGVFVVAFMMISAGQSMGNITVRALDNLANNSGFTFKILGQESLFAGMGSIQDFLWLIMTTAVLWLGVFAVLKKLSLVGGWFGRIGDKGKEYAIQAAKLPFVAPIIPSANGPISLKQAAMDNLGLTKLGKFYEGENKKGIPPANNRQLENKARAFDYNEYKDKKIDYNNEGAKIASALGYDNLGHMMSTEHESTLLANIEKMDGINGNKTEAKKFYEKLVTANGGRRAKPDPTDGSIPGTASAPAPAPAQATSQPAQGANVKPVNPDIADASAAPAEPAERENPKGEATGGVDGGGVKNDGESETTSPESPAKPGE